MDLLNEKVKDSSSRTLFENIKDDSTNISQSNNLHIIISNILYNY